MQRIFKELHALYGPPRLRRMALICHYTWCVTALSYYVTGSIFFSLMNESVRVFIPIRNNLPNIYCDLQH